MDDESKGTGGYVSSEQSSSLDTSSTSSPPRVIGATPGYYDNCSLAPSTYTQHSKKSVNSGDRVRYVPATQEISETLANSTVDGMTFREFLNRYVRACDRLSALCLLPPRLRLFAL